MSAWRGPTGADRDFCFPDREIEIKTVYEGADSVAVSSAEQLDLTSKPLFLSLVVLEDTVKGALPEAFTAIDIISRLQQTLTSDLEALGLFESRLIDAGFRMREEYCSRAFVLRCVRTFRIQDGFPAIRRSSLPPGIGKVTWELFVQAILPFEITNSIAMKADHGIE